MPDHYFSRHPHSKSSPKSWEYKLKGNVFTFTTDHGVFSKNEVDFGSRILIDTFKEPQIEGEILDLGCGYGPVGLSLAKTFPNRHFYLTDVNERAVTLAEHNAKQNNITNVTFQLSDRFEQLADKTFAAVLTNPPIRAGKKIVYQIFEDSYRYLNPSGTLWVVIQKKQGAPSAQAKLMERFGNAEVTTKKKGYHILVSKKVDPNS
ncbi:class I SAM-dependent methyltransferase [Aquibacillus sp. 3ASR75-11]|uniref:Class I SAM-dependent methyltransferase n=1 Tax=Terrihalobacillus insolitus TaxID=2950438 RepID=A0A9X3WY89_9BACI|nr:class I SAM-dependent methyltransferase [Terrihalobacillus insolitus]MDC3414651.1 class I SAM-dependent methyltransferase [Terrihalobacillus insolitus]MDC3425509.1 class I SAM-dependent methyltransferase [Terrihalobacillus insolitus]